MARLQRGEQGGADAEQHVHKVVADHRARRRVARAERAAVELHHRADEAEARKLSLIHI